MFARCYFVQSLLAAGFPAADAEKTGEQWGSSYPAALPPPPTSSVAGPSGCTSGQQRNLPSQVAPGIIRRGGDSVPCEVDAALFPPPADRQTARLRIRDRLLRQPIAVHQRVQQRIADDRSLPFSCGQLCALRYAVGPEYMGRTRTLSGMRARHYSRPGSFAFDLATAAQLILMRLEAGNYPHLTTEVSLLREALEGCRLVSSLPRRSDTLPQLVNALRRRDGTSCFLAFSRHLAAPQCEWGLCWPDNGDLQPADYGHSGRRGCVGVHDQPQSGW
jgi:hypothetical protein